jgi:hypothetical protein
MAVNNLQELKALAIAAKNDCGDYVALNDYGMAMPPAVTIGLIEEIERLRAALGEPAAKAWRIIDRKGKRFTVYHEGLATAIAETGLSVTPMCDMPPAGWECSRTPGHEGPCAASEVSDEH